MRVGKEKLHRSSFSNGRNIMYFVRNLKYNMWVNTNESRGLTCSFLKAERFSFEEAKECFEEAKVSGDEVEVLTETEAL